MKLMLLVIAIMVWLFWNGGGYWDCLWLIAKEKDSFNPRVEARRQRMRYLCEIK